MGRTPLSATSGGHGGRAGGGWEHGLGRPDGRDPRPGLRQEAPPVQLSWVRNFTLDGLEIYVFLLAQGGWWVPTSPGMCAVFSPRGESSDKSLMYNYASASSVCPGSSIPSLPAVLHHTQHHLKCLCTSRAVSISAPH